MTDLRQAAQQALDALETLMLERESIYDTAIIALREALAQPEQEPVAYYHPRSGFCWAKPTSIFAPTIVDVPPMALYAAPQRPWVGLTPEEILDLFDRNNVYGSKWIEFARTVEAKLKKRNCE